MSLLFLERIFRRQIRNEAVLLVLFEAEHKVLTRIGELRLQRGITSVQLLIQLFGICSYPRRQNMLEDISDTI